MGNFEGVDRPLCRQRNFPRTKVSDKEVFFRFSKVLQRRLALLMFFKFSDKLNVGGGLRHLLDLPVFYCVLNVELFSSYSTVV